MTLPADIPAGCYVAVRTGSVMGWVVRIATRSSYDHAAVCVGGGRIVEASAPHGVREAAIGEYGPPVAANTAETMTTRQRAAVVAQARSFLAAGDTYDWDDIAAIGLRELGLHWRLLLRCLRGGKKALICSEMVALCGSAAGLDWACGEPDPLYVTPAGLARRPQVRVVAN